MTVRINKPEFNIREKLKELTQSIGLKGRELMRAATIQDARDLVNAGRKNMVINGDMRIFQRDNSGNVSNTSTYFLDRFMARNNSAGTLYVTSQSNSTSGPPGFRSWLLAQCDGADTSVGSSDYVRIQHYVEGYNCFMDWGLAGGNTDHVSVSFWVKSNKTGTYCFNIEDGDALPVFCREYTIKNSDVWQKVELTIPPPTEGTWRGNDSNIGLRMTWTLMAGSGHPLNANTWNTSYGMRTDNQVNFMDDANNNFYLTGVQMEVGKNATEFEYRTYGEELALCQRYFYRYRLCNQEWIYNEGNGNSNKWHQFYIGHAMRPIGSIDVTDVTLGGSIGGLNGTITSFAPQDPGHTPSRISSRVTMSTSGGTARYIYHYDGWNSDYISVSAEL